MNKFECEFCYHGWSKEEFRDNDISFENNIPYFYNRGEVCPECCAILKQKSLKEGLADVIELPYWAFVGKN